MLKCPRCQNSFTEIHSQAGVMLDVCSGCSGVWFDQGELNFFVPSRKVLDSYKKNGLSNLRPTNYQCPHCPEKLKQGRLPEFNLEVEECGTCKGVFFEFHEFEKLKGSDKATAKKFKTVPNTKNIKLHIPPMGLTAITVLTGMYFVLFALMVFLVEAGVLIDAVAMGIAIVFVFIQFCLGPVIMDWSLRLIGNVTWCELQELPDKYRLAVERITTLQKIPMPRLGLINDMTPQAYTYGRGPNSARLVLSKGIVELLDKDELEAVVAHEFGHIKNWDFVLMTVAHLAPILFYHLYRVAFRSKKGSNDRKGNPILIAGIIAYFCYHISQFLVLFISRTREYHADRFSMVVTKKPNALAMALIKIGYGLMASISKDDERKDKKGETLTVQAFNIMNIETSKELAMAYKNSDEDRGESIKQIMSWDLWSPWAGFYELYSTHPLMAKRINAIATLAIQMKLKPDIYFDLKRPESYWDDFFWDFIIYLLPILAAVAAYFLSTHLPWERALFSHIIPAFGVGGLIRTMSTYPGGFDFYKVSSVLKQLKVSPVRSYAVKIKGKVIGRGNAGIIFSEDLMLQDSTGMIYLNHEPLGPNFLFGLLRFDKFLNEEVIVEGWYRRTPSPFIEVKKISTAKTSSQSYAYLWKIVTWLVVIVTAILFQRQLSNF